MAVYVDDAKILARVGKRVGIWSHMMADTEEELVRFAVDELGLNARWIQKKRSGVHFDVTEPKRQRALDRGAELIEVGTETWRQVVSMARDQFDGRPWWNSGWLRSNEVRHSHISRDLRSHGDCAACDLYVQMNYTG